jgi:hypothetical protein
LFCINDKYRGIFCLTEYRSERSYLFFWIFDCDFIC